MTRPFTHRIRSTGLTIHKKPTVRTFSPFPYSLPDTTLLYPAHDYVGLSATTVGEEKVHNPRLSKSKKVFVDIMNNLNLAYPKQIDRSLPANLVCGLQESLHVHAA